MRSWYGEQPRRDVKSMPECRLLIVSNRLPVTTVTGTNGVALVPSTGGLVSGLRPWHEGSNRLWLGWPGDVATMGATEREALDRDLRAEGLVPVHLTREQVDGYYHGFANRVLWPLFHYSIDRIPTDAAGWAEYQAVNDAFASAIAREYRPGDTVWVHDYHLMLVPALLRQRLPHARIGFFLHVPFPSSEVFRVLPWRHEILNGLLGADLIGFHTSGYMRHFLTSLLHIDGVEPDVDSVRVGRRAVKLGAFPMGVDAARFAALAATSEVRARVDHLRRDLSGRSIILGIDRLDYTKGIPRRLEAIARLLERDPTLRDHMRYIQIAVPSRGEVDSYQHFRRDVEETVGHMNGAYGTLESLPVHYVHQSVSPNELVALYCAADVMLVTPLRDGMNLVAKEFAASRIDDNGVLILSEFAGAAAELQGALTVNPYDIEALAGSIQRALSMPVEERRVRMRALRHRVCAHDVFTWADGFEQQLHTARPEPSGAPLPAPSLATVLADLRRTSDIRLLLDYDGTLVPMARSPELAVPDDDLLRLLTQLATSPGIEVDIVSGRPRAPLERWFGNLPISLWAEHGHWRRRPHDDSWEPAAPLDGSWMTRVKPILEQFAATTPGTHIEVKTASMAWHYREAPRDFGIRQAHELRLLLGDLLCNQPIEVLEGKKVIEVRMRGVNKGIVAQRVHFESSASVMVAIGDDRTDDDLFRALPPGAVSVAVGKSPVAAYCVDDHLGVRRLLWSLLDAPAPVGGPYVGTAVPA
jgi:trehalose 6-phosphate synthase/phosphatase